MVGNKGTPTQIVGAVFDSELRTEPNDLSDDINCIKKCKVQCVGVNHMADLESGGMDGGIHIFYGLLDLELLGIKFVFKFINGTFKFNNHLFRCFGS